MKRLGFAVICGLAAVGLSGCGGEWAQDALHPRREDKPLAETKAICAEHAEGTRPHNDCMRYYGWFWLARPLVP